MTTRESTAGRYGTAGKCWVWFLVLAFLSFVVVPGRGSAETVPVTPDESVSAGILSSLPEGNGFIRYAEESFCALEPVQLAQAVSQQDAVGKESGGTRTEEPATTTEEVKKAEGPSTAAKIAIVLVTVALVVLAVAAASFGGGFGFSGLNLNFGK
jgi:nitrate reductase NapE component